MTKPSGQAAVTSAQRNIMGSDIRFFVGSDSDKSSIPKMHWHGRSVH